MIFSRILRATINEILIFFAPFQSGNVIIQAKAFNDVFFNYIFDKYRL